MSKICKKHGELKKEDIVIVEACGICRRETAKRFRHDHKEQLAAYEKSRSSKRKDYFKQRQLLNRKKGKS